MAALLERVAAARTPRAERRYAIDTWLNDYLLPSGLFGYGGQQYPFGGNGLNQTLAGTRISEVANSLPGYAAALRSCPPAFAAQLVRALVLSQMRFTFRNLPSTRTPRRTFGTSDLAILERPWPNATTGELVARMEWHAGLAGNAYVTRRPAPEGPLKVLRPDWVGILYGSDLEPDDPAHALDGQLLGYVYANGGLMGPNPIRSIRVEDMAHWSPIPDPENVGIGQSWLTPAVGEVQVDQAVTIHKRKFFEQGATPNLVVKGIAGSNGEALSPEQFRELVDMLEEGHAGVANAYRTLYLTAGADATVVGANLADLDLKQVQGAGETRIAELSRVHPVILGSAEGLQGSSLNAGNFGMARRVWADAWIYPTLQDICHALAPLVRVPADAELWHDTVDMPILREDAKDAAEIVQIESASIGQLVRDGFTAESAKAAIKGRDVSLLVHSGLVSVQLQPPGAPPPTANGQQQPATTGT